MKEKKIIIGVAPTGGGGRGNHNPVDPDVIADDVIKSCQEGACIAHMHARDENGILTKDLTSFSYAVEKVKKSCNIILEASTGGLSELKADERILPVSNIYAEMGSLNLGSLNFEDKVYKNSIPDVKYWADEMYKYRIKPSLEIFDTGHLETALFLIEKDIIKTPCNFSFIFNVRWGMPFSPALIEYLKSRLPPGSLWGAVIVNTDNFSSHLYAAEAGASFVRTGFEDSSIINGKPLRSNAESVKALREKLEEEKFIIADTDEAREILFRR